MFLFPFLQIELDDEEGVVKDMSEQDMQVIQELTHVLRNLCECMVRLEEALRDTC